MLFVGIIILVLNVVLGIDVYADEGSTFIVVCPSKADSIALTWFGPPNQLTINDGISINPDQPNKDRLSITGDTSKGEYNLQITNIQQSDGGLYICTGVSGGILVTHKMNFIIREQPKSGPIILKTPLGSVTAGVIITVTCEVTGGKPLASIYWECSGLFNQQNLTQDNKTVSSIQLNTSKTDDGKICRCGASHPLWTTNKTAEIILDVLYSPDASPSIQQTPPGAIISGNKTKLTCTVSGGNPLATLSWNCPGTTTNNTSGNTASYSVDLTVDSTYNGRICTCSATHPVASYRPTAQHELVVYYSPNSSPSIQQIPPGAIIAGNKITLICTVSGGNPRATLSWDCTGTTTSNTSGNTASYSVEFTVDKTYNGRICTCSATHPVTSYRPTVQHGLAVFYPPDFNPCIQQIPAGDIIAGNKVTLTCTVSGGNPLAGLSWDCTGITTNNTSGNTASYSVELTVDKTYNGRMCSCSATHPVTSYKPTVQHGLVVFYPPDSNPCIQQIPAGVIIAGNKVTLTCTVSGGNPLTTLSWDCTGNTTSNTSWNTAQFGVELTVDETYNGRICTCSATHPVTSYRPTVEHELVIYWKPTLDSDTFSSPPVIGLKIGMLLNITVNVIANPLPSVQWTFEKNGLTDNITVLSTNIHIGFQFRSIIILSSIISKQFGLYTTIISNSIGTFTKTFSVIQKEQPTSSNHVHAVCKINSAIIIWRTAFNGGSEQHFNVQFWKEGELVRLTLRQNISDPGLELDNQVTVGDLTPDTHYWFSILAINEIGSSNSKPVNCTTDGHCYTDRNNSNCYNGSELFATGICAIFIAVVMILVFTIVNRFRSKGRTTRRSDNYVDLNTTNTSSNDAYTTLQEAGTKKTNAENQQAYDECHPPQDNEIETIYNN